METVLEEDFCALLSVSGNNFTLFNLQVPVFELENCVFRDLWP